jgi:hypothetical protein
MPTLLVTDNVFLFYFYCRKIVVATDILEVLSILEVRNGFLIRHLENINVDIDHRFMSLRILGLIQNFNSFILIQLLGVFFKKSKS